MPQRVTHGRQRYRRPVVQETPHPQAQVTRARHVSRAVRLAMLGRYLPHALFRHRLEHGGDPVVVRTDPAMRAYTHDPAWSSGPPIRLCHRSGARRHHAS